jgi:predicted Zn-ribbon and HTH transcriptional regulator
VFGTHIRLGLGDILIKELTFEDPLAINETTQTRRLISQDNGDNINKGVKMNKKQLDKIIALRGALEDAEFLLSREENEIFVVPTSHNYCGSESKKLRFSKSALLVYCDKVKAELKELGYEE